jgi:drug/metabolite transporter (DMT)-like permease
MASQSTLVETQATPTSYWLGVAIVVLGTVAFSLAGMFTRLIHVDVWKLLFWRGIFACSTVLFFAWLTAPRGKLFGEVTSFGWPQAMLITSSAVSMIAFLTSIRLTSVADNSIIFGTAPLVTAAIAYIALRERTDLVTLVLAVVALAGVAVVMLGPQGGGANVGPWPLGGDLLACVMTLFVSIMTVVIRKYPSLPMLPAAGLSSLLVSGLVLPLSWSPFTVTWSDLGMLLLFGVLQQGAGLICIMIGSRMIPASHSALISTLDVPLAPLFVWLVVGEVPARAAFTGGALVLLAVVGHMLMEAMKTSPGTSSAAPRALGTNAR